MARRKRFKAPRTRFTAGFITDHGGGAAPRIAVTQAAPVLYKPARALHGAIVEASTLRSDGQYVTKVQAQELPCLLIIIGPELGNLGMNCAVGLDGQEDVVAASSALYGAWKPATARTCSR